MGLAVEGLGDAELELEAGSLELDPMLLEEASPEFRLADEREGDLARARRWCRGRALRCLRADLRHQLKQLGTDCAAS
jgi:hypothetical protein